MTELRGDDRAFEVRNVIDDGAEFERLLYPRNSENLFINYSQKG
jgi:hypothetical protein